MSRTQSSTIAKSDKYRIGFPSVLANGTVWVAAVIFASGGSVVRKRRKNSRKFAESDGLTPFPFSPS